MLWLLIGSHWPVIVGLILSLLAVAACVFLRLPWGVAFAAIGLTVAVTSNHVIYDRGWRDAVKAGKEAGAAKDAKIAGEISAANNAKVNELTVNRLKDQEKIDALTARLAAAKDQCGLTDDDIGGLPLDRSAKP